MAKVIKMVCEWLDYGKTAKAVQFQLLGNKKEHPQNPESRITCQKPMYTWQTKL